MSRCRMLGRVAASVGLRVGTANAASGRDARGAPDHPAWAADAAALDVDVLGVQEVDHLLPRSGGADQTEVLRAALGPGFTARFAAAVHGTPGSHETFRPAASTVADEPSYGIALLTRLPVRAWHELRLAPSRVRLPVPLPPGAGRRVLWAPDEPRVALAAVVGTPGGEVTVVTTHLSFAPPRAVRQLREVVAWARPLPRPLVLLGDLNLPGGLPARLTGWTPAATGPTYPARRPRRRLDHVLVDAGPGDVGVAGAGTRVVGGSDHLAVVAEVVGL